jgi:signal transduction histidine kinase
MFLTLFVTGVALACILLGFIVLTRNYTSRLHLKFSLFAMALGLWIIFNYFGSYYNPNPSLAILFYADFATAPILALLFASYGTQSLKFYRRTNLVESRWLIAALILAAIFSSITAITHLVATPQYVPGNVTAIKQPFYEPYTLITILLALTGLISLLYAAMTARKEFKRQTRTILGGIAIVTITVIATNFVFSNSRLAQALSYFTILIMLVSLSYSIVRFKLFDIRLILARSLTYGALVSVFVAFYVLVVFIIGKKLFGNISLTIQQQAGLLLLIGITSLSYPRLRSYFDQLVERIFYKSSYNAQTTVEQYSKLTRTLVDLDQLIKGTIETLEKTVSPSYISFYFNKADDPDYRLYKATNQDADLKFDKQSLAKYAEKNKSSDVVSYDLIDAVDPLYQYMSTNGISAILIIRSGIHPDGYILLGPKKSGGFYSKHDIQLLSIISSQFAISLQNAKRFTEIKQFNITLQEKIDEATKKLRHANVRLKELDATKDEFISMASHQLRTPLTTIKGYLSMILDGDVGTVKKEEKELVQHAFDSAQRMVYLIADLLNVSRLQTGKFVIENKPTDLAKVVDGEITQLGEQATTRNIRLAYDKPKEFPALNLDETKIRQVIMNFLDNALYYTPKDGEVTAKLEATQDSVNFTVTDTGVGVPASLQHHLFTKFYRADNARKMRPDGTGLGLYMAKKVIVAQGGAVIFKSTEGKGSTFGFSFPRKTMEVKA